MLKNRMSFRVAFCGILAALMTVIMLVGPLIPTMTYVAPAAAGVFLIPVVWEFGGKAGGLLYAAVALLAFFLAPDKEAALCFVLLFGWYPVARPKLQHIRQKPVRLVVKLALFNAALLAIYAPVRLRHAGLAAGGPELDGPAAGGLLRPGQRQLPAVRRGAGADRRSVCPAAAPEVISAGAVSGAHGPQRSAAPTKYAKHPI